jgi:hypothetical protein
VSGVQLARFPAAASMTVVGMNISGSCQTAGSVVGVQFACFTGSSLKNGRRNRLCQFLPVIGSGRISRFACFPYAGRPILADEAAYPPGALFRLSD